ncbi:hypothetical protein Megvenef_01692 [Candidatus Megaera venefica]|uniref:Four helix bundle protein n=1 Tax=Candidatus Megaera venefica TaxID=2055910 RepID=A0ABU5NF00_9RICK|nr:hypothetical protein [Candidatus Megaera venefica]
MCGDLFLKFLKLYQKFRVLTERLIICIEQAPALLTKQEKNSLENSINLLKTRLLYG